MFMYINTGAIVIRKQNKYIDMFNKVGAIDATNSVSLSEIGIRRSFIFNRMVSRVVFNQCEDDKFYVDNIAAVFFKEYRRKKALILLVLVLVIVGISYLLGIIR